MDNTTGNTTGNTSVEIVTEYKLPNLRHMQFIREYLKCKNGQEAYMMVYPKVSSNVARAASSRLLANVNIKAAIDAIKEEVRAKYKIEQEEMVAQLLALIAEARVNGDRNNWNKAIDTLNKMAGFYQTKVDITSGGERININLNLKDE